MRRLEDEKTVREFLDRVCRHVRSREIHPDIREEFCGHIADRAASLQLEGYAEDDAITEAVKQMGSPEAIGKSLHQAHKPRLDWKMLVILAFMVMAGLFGMLNVEASESLPVYFTLFTMKAVLTGLGLAALAICYFLDYRKLKKYSRIMFFGVLALMTYTLLAGSQINGRQGYLDLGFIMVNVVDLSLLLLLISLAGLKQESPYGIIDFVIKTMYRCAVPALLFSLGGSPAQGMMYLTGFLVLTWASSKEKRLFYMISLPIAVLSALSFMLFRGGYILQRLGTFLNPSGPEAYHWNQIEKAISSAGWSGHGFASTIKNLPYLQSESLFPYLIYCFGWGAGILVVLLVLMFLLRIGQMKLSLTDPYAKKVTTSLLVLFGFRLLWPILMAFGFVPIISIELPFIGYGGTLQIFDYAAVGMLMSMYRRKNMLRSADKAAA